MMTLDPDTRRLLIAEVAHTLSVNLQPMLAEIVTASTRPSVLYRPTLKQLQSLSLLRSLAGTVSWTAEYGDVRGGGVTPEEAMVDFDKKWREK